MTANKRHTEEQVERINKKRLEMLLEAVGEEYGLAARLEAMRGGGWR